MNPSRIRKVAAALKPTTLLGFHRALKQRKWSCPGFVDGYGFAQRGVLWCFLS